MGSGRGNFRGGIGGPHLMNNHQNYQNPNNQNNQNQQYQQQNMNNYYLGGNMK